MHRGVRLFMLRANTIPVLAVWYECSTGPRMCTKLADSTIGPLGCSCSETQDWRCAFLVLLSKMNLCRGL